MYDLNRRPSMGMGSRYPPPHPPPPHHGGTALQNPSQYLSNSQPNSSMNQLGGQMVRIHVFNCSFVVGFTVLWY